MNIENTIIKTLRGTLLACLLVSSCLMYAQQQGNPTAIMGSWSLNYDLTLADISGVERENYQKANGTIQNKMRQFLSGRRFDFFNDGRFTITNTDGSRLSGVWEFRGSGLLSMLDQNGVEIYYRAGLDGNLLMLVPQGEAMRNVLFKRLFFNRAG